MTAIGEREDDPSSAHVLEWTGSAWAPVCPTDGVAIVEYVGGWLTCGTCGVRADRLGRGGR